MTSFSELYYFEAVFSRNDMRQIPHLFLGNYHGPACFDVDAPMISTCARCPTLLHTEVRRALADDTVQTALKRRQPHIKGSL